MIDRKTSLATLLALGAAMLMLAVAAPPAAAGDKRLTLRVNDAEAPPGGVVAIVLRTYASRPIGQGQICFRARDTSARAGAQSPFHRIENFEVFGRGRTRARARIDARAGGAVVVNFSSNSASINRSDGPLAVVFLRLGPAVAAGQQFAIEIDPAQTMLVGANGREIPTRLKGGELTVRHPGDAFGMDIATDQIRPGDTAKLAIQTQEPFRLASGQVGLVYDPEIAARAPRVKMDRRHGQRNFTVDTTTPGLVLVNFESRRGRANSVPGHLIEVRLPTSRDVPVGTVSRVSLDPSLTFVVDQAGDVLPLRLSQESIRFVASSRGPGSNDDDSDGDSDDDSDSDSDDDSDSDSDDDSDSDSDDDSDSDSDEDSDSDSDDDSDSDSDDAADPSLDDDSDSDSDDDSDSDSDEDSDSDSDDDSDSSSA